MTTEKDVCRGVWGMLFWVFGQGLIVVPPRPKSALLRLIRPRVSPVFGLFVNFFSFTSLGGTLDTHPNPSLKSAEGEGFKPAYELLDESKERCGRD